MRAAVFVVALACTAPEPGPTAPVPHPWQVEDQRPGTEHGFFERHPALADLSWFATSVSGQERPSHAYRGAFGVGNGRVFALQGLADPLSTLHGLVGPRYRRGARFFGDLALEPRVDGMEEPSSTESIGRPRRTSLAVTERVSEHLRLWTVDLAPRSDGERPLPALLRMVLVRNLDDQPHEVRLELSGPEVFQASEGRTRTSTDGARTLVLSSPGRSWEASQLVLGTLQPGEEREFPVWMSFGDSPEEADAVADALETRDLDALVASTVAWWHQATEQGTRLEVGDPVLHDLLEGLETAVRVQLSEGGGVTPMSRYTGSWLRDTIGPVRFFARSGLHAEARGALEYLEMCHRDRGDITNSCSSGLLEEEVPEQVAWDALGPLEPRVSAEGPSYLPLAWTTLADWTGDDDGLLDHWSYLRRSVLRQAITEDGQQRWSGDETFRLAMNVALGQALEVPWEDLAWSSNSNILGIAAAGRLAEAAERLGQTEDAQALRDFETLSRVGLERLRRPGGHYAALERTDGDEPIDLPFEDAALKILWAGAMAPDEPAALDNLASLEALAGAEPGSFQSPPAPLYAALDDDLGVGTGVATGMLPGYALWNLVATGHPDHDAAFDQVLRYASPSGQFNEGLVYGSRAAFQPFYDVGGTLGDVAARFRPWEGGIVGDALWFSLLGAEPYRAEDGWGLRMRPRIPNGGDHLHAEGIQAGGATVDVEVEFVDGWRIEVRNQGPPVEVDLSWPLGVWTDVTVEASGGAGAVQVLPLGERVFRADPVSLGEGDVWRMDLVVRERVDD